MQINLKGIIYKHDRVGRMHSGGMITKVEEKEKRSTNRALEDSTLDRARRGDKTFVVFQTFVGLLISRVNFITFIGDYQPLHLLPMNFN